MCLFTDCAAASEELMQKDEQRTQERFRKSVLSLESQATIIK